MDIVFGLLGLVIGVAGSLLYLHSHTAKATAAANVAAATVASAVSDVSKAVAAIKSKV